MKKIFLLIFLALFSNAYSQYLNIPDVMGISNPGNSIPAPYNSLIFTDSLQLFPGFPVLSSGQSFEGMIFCNMDSDVELEIVENIGSTIHAFNIDGSNVTGWPKTTSEYLEGAPAFGDIDGDNQGEIVCVSNIGPSNGTIHAYKIDGTPVAGFPITHGYSARTPVLADLNNDNKLEIIINKRLKNAGEVWIYRGDGTVYPGWPQPINHVPASSSAVGDITGDGIPEVISESFIALYAWDKDGKLITGFPFELQGFRNSYSSPVLADLNNDGFREIIFGAHASGTVGGCVYILQNNGILLPGWPQYTGSWIYSAPTVGYINDDNILDIAIGDQAISFSPVNYLFCWDATGKSLPGFPVGPIRAINTQPLLGDIDGDKNLEFIVDDNSNDQSNNQERGYYHAYNHDGTPVAGWPLEVRGFSFYNNPCLADMDHDGFLDIIGSSFTNANPLVTSVYLWKTNENYIPSKIILPVFQYNIQHTGVYRTPPVVNIQNESSSISDYKLYQNYPNPFNPTTEIKFSISKQEFVSLKIFDITGRVIADLINRNLNSGNHNITWNAENFSSGVYYYKLTTNDFSETRKMILLK